MNNIKITNITTGKISTVKSKYEAEKLTHIYATSLKRMLNGDLKHKNTITNYENEEFLLEFTKEPTDINLSKLYKPSGLFVGHSSYNAKFNNEKVHKLKQLKRWSIPLLQISTDIFN